MLVRLITCESSDSRIIEARRRSPTELGVRFVDSNEFRDLSTDPYVAALRALHARKVDAVIAGAEIALAEFLPGVFATFSGSRRRGKLIFGAAPIEPIGDAPFVLVDPCVVVDPTASELATMANEAARLYSAIYARNDPYVGIISHSTGNHRLHADPRAKEVVAVLKADGQVPFCDTILQVDAALSVDSARRKAAAVLRRPNVLVCTSIGVANGIYKALEVFGQPSVRLSGAILLGVNEGLIGLLARTTTADEVERLFANISRATTVWREQAASH